MSDMEFHILVRSEVWNETVDDIHRAIDGVGTVSVMARRQEHAIFRIHGPSDAYMYFLLKYGKDEVWKR